MLEQHVLEDIQKLQSICEQEEHIELKLNFDMLRSRKQNEVNDFFHYEDNQLVGFIGLYGFGNTVEICGMVAPSYRRKRIFSKLFSQALHICKKRGYTEILLNAPGDSVSGREFLKQIPCSFTFSEYQMKWTQKELEDDNPFVTLRSSQSDTDMKMEIQVDVECFGMSLTEAAAYYEQTKTEEQQNHFIVEYNSQAVGKLRVSYDKSEAWIYGFGILPSYQKLGIGKAALKQVVLKQLQLGYDIFLEVEAKNKRALQLYETCGFNSYHVQDYYVYSL
ncbi:GNAT family N-acetyltransferase [Priestia megaterium]|uniref:GNAT family N-acetyltransferase n=1 Tax=Priestia megaterium TaxID=1404 RepID=UPI000BEE2D74|nr:GNAT family N-acetyltransferase [Priestia megaterium]PEA36816.1 GNAT family N-acetyltransferase [Priestia megaterium]PEE45659.1 GNAT family N-acetyltransferase [Priestia megaterium]